MAEQWITGPADVWLVLERRLDKNITTREVSSYNNNDTLCYVATRHTPASHPHHSSLVIYNSWRSGPRPSASLSSAWLPGSGDVPGMETTISSVSHLLITRTLRRRTALHTRHNAAEFNLYVARVWSVAVLQWQCWHNWLTTRHNRNNDNWPGPPGGRSASARGSSSWRGRTLSAAPRDHSLL